MKGTIKQRGKGTWMLRVDTGLDPKTGKRRQRTITFHGTKRQAEAKLRNILQAVDKGEYVEPSKTTFGGWLDRWVETVIKPGNRIRTYETYRSVINTHLKPCPTLGPIKLQKLHATHIMEYYTNSKLSRSTLQQHQAIVHHALRDAQAVGLVTRNVAAQVIDKPKARELGDTILEQVWSAEEAQKFLLVAKEAGPQQAAFYGLALESGLRLGEVCGLKWDDIDFEKGSVRVTRQLLKPGAPPVLTPLKREAPRTISISDDTLRLLREHKRHQAEIKLKNRQAYHDYGLVFAKEWRHKRTDCLGHPLSRNNLTEREFAQLIKKAAVKRISFHGLRHTSATLALDQGIPVKVVSERLGHKRTQVTLDTYAHAMPSTEKSAAQKLGRLLHS